MGQFNVIRLIEFAQAIRPQSIVVLVVVSFAKVLITVSPHADNAGETLSSLRFGARASLVENAASENVAENAGAQAQPRSRDSPEVQRGSLTLAREHR